MAMALGLCAQETTFAQVTSKPLEFEVASVRQAAPEDSQASSPGRRGTTGAGAVAITSDRASYRNITLKSLLMRAYDLEPFQISGPAWIDSERYDVVATIPEGTAKVQDVRDLSVFSCLPRALVVRLLRRPSRGTGSPRGAFLGVGKGGSKLKVSVERKKPAPGATVKFGNDYVVETLYGVTTLAFARDLSRMLGRPVIDSTGLSGEFDIVLSLAKGAVMPVAQETAADGSEADSSMASLFRAVQDLGLTLSFDKVPDSSALAAGHFCRARNTGF